MASPIFAEPDWNAPLDVDARIEAVPEDAVVRGMFIQDLVDIARNAGQPDDSKRYIAFKTYPVREYVRLIAETAARLAPNAPLREACRRLGRTVYPTFEKTMVGSAIFAFAGRRFDRVAHLAAKAYGVALNPSNVSTTTLAPGHIRAELRSIYALPECFQVGVWEGAMEVCGVEGLVDVAIHSDCDVDFDVHWGEDLG